MNNNGFSNGDGRHNDLFPYELEEPIHIKGFSVTYDRKFNVGNFESLAPSITIWVKTNVTEGETFDLHHAKERLRHMARENVRAQLLQLQGNSEVVFLGLQPPANDRKDPIFVRTISVSLAYKVNLGNYNSITPGYTDWADVRHVAHSPGDLHMALDRMWQSLWANVEDEISRAQGQGGTGGFFGLPSIEVEDLTITPQANGHFDKPNTVGPLSASRVSAANGSGT
ncbi:MAG: hypothetical protein ACE5FD_02750 [Anaerolineae bacterium]